MINQEDRSTPISIVEEPGSHLVSNVGIDTDVGRLSGYSETAIGLTIEKTRSAILRSLGNSPEIEHELSRLASGDVHIDSGVGFLDDEGTVMFRSTDNRVGVATTLLRIAFKADPRLLQPEYIEITLPPSNTRKVTTFSGFNPRLRSLLEKGNLTDASPASQIMACTLMHQIGRVKARAGAEELMRRSASFGGLTDKDKLKTFVDKKRAEIDEVKKDDLYSKIAASTIKRISTSAGYSSEQVRLLQDLCFLREENVAQRELALIVDPLMKLVGKGEWDEAFKYQNFLLTAFKGLFPGFRQQDETSGTQHYRSFKQVRDAIANRALVFAPSEIPEGYREYLGLPPQEDNVSEDKPEYRMAMAQSSRLSELFLRETASTATEFYHGNLPWYLPYLDLEKTRVYYFKGKQYVYEGTKSDFLRNADEMSRTPKNKRKPNMRDPFGNEMGLFLARIVRNNDVSDLVNMFESAFAIFKQENHEVTFRLKDYAEAMFRSVEIDITDPTYSAVLRRL